MEQKKRPTIAYIADRAGVHPSTVSRALRGQTARIAPDTVERIRKVADELDFAPNPTARNLRSGRMMAIGVILPSSIDYEIAQLIIGAQRRAFEHDYQVFFVNPASSDHPTEAARRLERRVDGLVIGTASRGDAGRAELAGVDSPFVLLMRTTEGFPAIRGDDELGGYLATGHLLDLGHTRVAHLGGRFDVSTGYDRYRGYLRAHEERGVPVDPRLVYEGDFMAATARANAARMLALDSRPTAVFAANDMSALATIAAAAEAGLDVPRDLSVVGYNNSEFSALLPIPLTTVHVGLADMGGYAIDALIGMLAGTPAESRVLPPSLIVRGSTMPLTV